jgi:hypothetical protein
MSPCNAIAFQSMAYRAQTFDQRPVDGTLADQFTAKAKLVLEGWTEDVHNSVYETNPPPCAHRTANGNACIVGRNGGELLYNGHSTVRLRSATHGNLVPKH